MKTNRHTPIRTFLIAVLTVLFSLGFQNGTAQIGQITLPGSYQGGQTPYDVLAVDNFLFVHTGTNIVIYYASSRTYFDTLNLTDNNYGKFNPVFYDERLHGKSNLMAYDNIKKELYTVTPELHIKRYRYNQQSNSFKWIETFTRPPVINNLAPLHGMNILKFDAYNGTNPDRSSRLYWVVKGRDDDPDWNCTGHFHVRERYFAIIELDVDEAINDTRMVLHYNEHVRAVDDYNGSAISDVEFQHDSESNYFFLTKLERFEMWEITDTGIADEPELVIHVSDVLPDSSDYDRYRFIRMLYIYDPEGIGDADDIHKIVAIPYRHPSRTINASKMLVYDVGDGTHRWFDVPSRRTLDATYLSVTNDLVLSYAPDPDEILMDNLDNSDIAVYHYNDFNDTFTLTEYQNTNQAQNKSDHDLNASYQVTKINGTTALIAKKDQVIKMQWNAQNNQYDYVEQQEAEGNYFYTTTTTGSNSFIIDRLAQKILCFSNGDYIEGTNGETEDIHLGYPVTHIAVNTSGDRLYFYHKMNCEKTGLYVYDISDGSVENLNIDDNNTNNDINGMIGEVVYNPYTKQFLVSLSDFETGAYYIRIINDNNWNTSPPEFNIPLPTGVTYPKEMYIGPDKRLYVMANMQSGSASPKLLVYAADELANYQTYELIYSADITISGTFNDDFEYWSAHFSFNSLDRKVYATVHPTKYIRDPYTSVPNSIPDFILPISSDPNLTGTGELIRCDATDITILKDIDVTLLFPGKMVCPNAISGKRVSVFENKLFVLGEHLYEYDLPTGQLSIAFSNEGGIQYNDLVYSPELDMLFGMKDVEGEYSSDRRIRVDKIFYNDVTKVLEYEILDLGTSDGMIKGQAAGMHYNPYNMQLYIHLKYDNKKLGGTDVSLLHFDPVTDPIDLQGTEGLGMTSFYPELDHYIDYHYAFYPLNKPYFNPYNNKIYVPNGAHSKVSVLDFTPKEPLFLTPVDEESNQSITWLSFPRLNQNNNGDPPTVHQVLGDSRIDPNTYETGSKLENLPPNADFVDPLNNTYNKPNWPASGQGINEIFSPLGYMLTLDYLGQTGSQPHLYLEGEVLPITNSFTLFAEEKENWVGYWLYTSQDVFEALGDAIDEVYEIHHEQWYCIKGMAPWYNPQGTPPPTHWFCDKETRMLTYGDMVIMKSESMVSGFQWRLGGHRPYKIMPAEEPAYFSYTQQATYTPLVVELDSANQQALEIGAFVGDSCVGATVINPGDSIVVIRAYLENSPVDSVGFQFYYGTKSTATERVSSYFVWNDYLQEYIRRPLYSSERKQTHFISMKNRNKEMEENGLPGHFNIWPNPASEKLNYSLRLEEEEQVKISLFDLTGKQLAIILEGPVQGGTIQGSWGLKHLKAGVYVVECKAGQLVEMKKLIIQ